MRYSIENSKRHYLDFNYLKYIHREAKKLISEIEINSNEIDEIYWKNKKKFLPDRIYKFYKPNKYSFDSITNGTIWASNPKNFNDPFEARYEIDKDGYHKHFIIKHFKKDKKIRDHSNDFISNGEYKDLNKKHYEEYSFRSKLKKIMKQKSENFNEYINLIEKKLRLKLYNTEKKIKKQIFYVASFTQSNFNFPMWAHYTDNYKGFCVEYDLSDFKESTSLDVDFQKKILNRFFPIKYTSKEYKISTTSLIKPNSRKSIIEFENKIINSLLIKSKDWSYEKEWRLILNKENRKKGYKIAFPYVNRIICGYNMRRSHIEKIYDISKNGNFEVVIQYRSSYSMIPSYISYENYINELEKEERYKKLIFRKKRSSNQK